MRSSLEQEAYDVPYCFLHWLNNTGIGAFVNSDTTLPGGPGGGRYRREEITRKTRVVRNVSSPARSTDDVSGVLLDTSMVVDGHSVQRWHDYSLTESGADYSQPTGYESFSQALVKGPWEASPKASPMPSPNVISASHLGFVGS